VNIHISPRNVRGQPASVNRPHQYRRLVDDVVTQ
jgi:hypothetical protein